jgi:hypothetical protein
LLLNSAPRHHSDFHHNHQFNVFKYDDDDDAGELRAFRSDVCIAPLPADLDCSQIPYGNFRVIYAVPQPDPHNFDGDRDGIGCES